MTGDGCSPGSGGELPIGDLLALVDCRADALGWGGYQALGYGSWFAAILTGLLTVAVALQGYRMLAGRTPALHDGLAGIARIGLAIALANSVGAYGTLIYRVATDAPFEISARLNQAAGLSADDLPARLDRVYTAIRLDPETRGRLASGGEGAAPRPAGTTDPGQRSAATLFVTVSAGPWLAMRLTTALLLALGPVAALMLVFDATVGLFLNWLRALGGMAIATTGLAVAIPLQMEALEPVIEHAGTGTPDYTAIVAITGVFGIFSGAILVAAYRMTGLVVRRSATRWPAGSAIATVAAGSPDRCPAPTLLLGASRPDAAIMPPAPPAPRSHVSAVTGALASAARRHDPATVTVNAEGAGRSHGLAHRAPPATPAGGATTVSALTPARRGPAPLRLSSARTSPR